ncbi:hypothetical protein BSKO_07703 [Bryopsis sp. KO-2023]|nr:hypothetical protein BSKO_07703 [Bryopsis sp. KO-2023]
MATFNHALLSLRAASALLKTCHPFSAIVPVVSLRGFCAAANDQEGEPAKLTWSSPHLEKLGISAVEWREVWVRNGSTRNLEENLDLLKSWGMAAEGRRKVATSTPVLVDLPSKALEKKLRWLTENLAFGSKDVVQVVKGNPRFLQCSLDDDLEGFTKIFLKEGYTRGHIKRMALKHPQVLGRTKKLRAMLTYFENNAGINPKEMLQMIIKFPQIVGYSLENNLEPKIEGFKRLNMSQGEIAGVVKSAPELLASDFDSSINSKITWMQEKLMFKPWEALHILLRQPKVFMARLATWESNRQFFISLGFSSGKVASLLHKSPLLLSRGTDGLREKFSFAKEVLRKGTDDIIRCPDYFTYSFEDRILFRVVFLDCRGQDFTRWGLNSLVKMPKSDFEERFGKRDVQAFEKSWADLDRESKLKCLGSELRSF